MSTKVQAPEPSPEERALQQQSFELAQRQAEQQRQFEPFIRESLGLIEDPETGELRRLTQEEITAGMTEEEQRAAEITRLSQESQQQALAGELPISPALERELTLQEQQTREQLSRRLGPGFETTTAGQQALGAFQQRAGLLREEARRGQITSGQGILQSRLSGFLGRQQQQFGQFQGAGAGALGLLGGLGQAQQPFQFQRGLQFQAAQQTAANRAQLLGDIAGAVGTGAGLIATGGLSGIFPKAPV